MNKHLRLLMVEDSEDDTLLALRELRHAGYEVEYERVDNQKEMRRALREREWDLVFADNTMPQFSASAALALLNEHGIDVPFIIVSGTITDETASAAMRAGAHDYIIKGNLARLVPAVERELREASIRRERRQAEQSLQQHMARISLLNQIARAIAERQDPESIFRAALQRLEENLPLDGASMYRWHPEADALAAVCHGPLLDHIAAPVGTKIPIEQTGLRACLTGETVYYSDTAQVDAVTPQRAARRGFRSWVACPLMSERQIFGVLLAVRRKVEAFSPEEREFLQQLGEHISVAATSAGMYQDLQTAYEELKRAQSRMVEQERLRALGTMASGVAHDFNNALSPILGFTDLLLHDPEQKLSNKARVTRYLKMMNTAARDAAQIVNRLREFYRAREKAEPFLPVDLNAIAEEAVALTQPKWKDQSQAKGIHIEVKRDLQELPEVAANQSELRQVLANLIFNAVDAMPNGGTITIRTREQDDRVLLEVADTGTGMTQEVRLRCLDPFFTTKGTEGTGLGLSMVFGIIKRHDGVLDIQSEPGKGTTVSISLPAYSSLQKAERREAGAPGQPPPSLRILFIDDEEMVRETVQAYLTDDGHVVELATNGVEGLQKFHAGRFDLVITDRAMPEMSGDQVALAIKRTAPNKPIIMLTGFGEYMQAIGEKPGGVDEIISKPPTYLALRGAIARVTGHASSRAKRRSKRGTK